MTISASGPESASMSAQSPFAVEPGVWVVVLGELCVFTLFFGTFLYYRALAPEVFDTSSATLNQSLGVLNTLVLLASSWSVATAVDNLQRDKAPSKAIGYLVAAILCGVVFVLIKAIEYSDAISEGYSVLTDDFYMFYFMLTGIHLAHLLFGMLMLVGITRHLRALRGEAGELNVELIGFGTCFWHMIDIVWIVLFPLLYLLR